MEPSDATLHLQVYSTLAYGGRGIQYFTYVTPEVGNYRLGALDPFGHRTPTWDMLRRVNLEIQALAPWLNRLTSSGVYHSDPVPEGSQPMSGSRWVEQVSASTADKSVAARYLLGEFKGEDGRPYLMLVNRDLAHSIHFSIKLRQPHHAYKADFPLHQPGGRLWRRNGLAGARRGDSVEAAVSRARCPQVSDSDTIPTHRGA